MPDQLTGAKESSEFAHNNKRMTTFLIKIQKLRKDYEWGEGAKTLPLKLHEGQGLEEIIFEDSLLAKFRTFFGSGCVTHLYRISL